MNEKKMRKALLAVFIFALVPFGLSATLTYSPPSPRTGETVTFTLSPSGSPAGSINWNFGDGSPVQSGTNLTVTHVYASAGSYMASASFFTMSHAQVDQAVVVVTNPRQIGFSPPQPRAGQPIAFTALNFYSSCIRWDFGDGTVKNGTASESHTYANAGSYTVSAWEECGATYGAAVPISVAEKEAPPQPIPPISPTQPTLAVTFVSLHFAAGKADVSVAKDFAGLQAFADIQVSGTGILQWQWLVDDMVVKSDTLAVSFGNKFTLDSGKVPGLPTSVPGRHRVMLSFQQPAVSFAIPGITYFVALKGAAPVVRRVTPDTLAPGSEYKLDLEGAELTSGTEISFPPPLAVVKKANILSQTQAQVIVFVAPTAAAGTKAVTARNQYGQTTGPGQVTIVSPQEALPGPNRPTPTPRPPRCPDIAITEIKATLVSTQVGDPSVDFPHDTVQLEVTLENVGNKEVPSLFIIDLFVKRNGEVIFSAGEPGWSTKIGAPGSRFVVEGITDSFPHNLKTIYTVEALPLYNECSTANNQASLTIDEYKLHHQFRPGKTPPKPAEKPSSPSSIIERLKTMPRILGWIDCYPYATPPFADAMICLLRNEQPVSDAIVKVDGIPLTYGMPYSAYYSAKINLDNPLGHEFSVSVSVDGNTYTGKGGKIDNIVQLVQPATGTTFHPPIKPQIDFQWTYSSGIEPMVLDVQYHCPPPYKVLFSGPVAADHVAVSTALLTAPGGGLQAFLSKEFGPIVFDGLAALKAKVGVFHSSFRPQNQWIVSYQKGPKAPPPSREAKAIPLESTFSGLLKTVPRMDGQIEYFPGQQPVVSFSCHLSGEGMDLSDAVVKLDGVVVPHSEYGLQNYSLTINESVAIGHRFSVSMTTNGKTYTGLSGPIDEIYQVMSPKDGATIIPRQWPHIDCSWLNYGIKPVELDVTFWENGNPTSLFDQLVFEDHAHVSTDRIPDGHTGTISAGLRTWYPSVVMDGLMHFTTSIQVVVKKYIYLVVAN